MRGFVCPHVAKSISATGCVYCIRCGAVLGFACSHRPCGCPADPFVFGHLCAPGVKPLVTTFGITPGYR